MHGCVRYEDIARVSTYPSIMEAPTRAGERIEALDVIRGVALFGVLLVNIVTAFRESIFEPYAAKTWNPPSASDVALSHFVSTYVETKALVLEIDVSHNGRPPVPVELTAPVVR